MAGGSFYVGGSGDYSFNVNWSSSGQSVYAELTVTKLAYNSQTYNNGANSSSLLIDGAGWSGAIYWDMRSAAVGSYAVLASTTVTVGGGTCYISAYFPTGTSNVGTVSGGQSVTIVTNYPSALNTIAGFNLEDSVTLTYGGSNPASAQKNLAISVNKTTIRTVDNFVSGTTIKFTSAEIAKVYRLLGTAKTGAMSFVLTTVGYGTSSRNPSIKCVGTAHMKISDAWKRCVTWVNINDSWKRCVMNEKISGVWKRGK
jgi:hypothetical protein